METIGLLSLHRAETVQKHSREMLAALSICFQEPLVFKIKKASLSSKYESQGIQLEKLEQVYCFNASLGHEVSSWTRDATGQKCLEMYTWANHQLLNMGPFCIQVWISGFANDTRKLWQKWAAFPMEFLGVESVCPCPPETEHVPSTFPPSPSLLALHPGAQQLSKLLTGPCGHLSVPPVE